MPPCNLPRMLEGRMSDLQRQHSKRGALTRQGSGRTGWRAMWLLGVVVTALAVLLLLAVGSSPPLPPQEALEESPGYGAWKVVGILLSVDGEAATIRLQHPSEAKIVAVLHYRLVSSSVFEVPDGAGSVAPAGP